MSVSSSTLQTHQFQSYPIPDECFNTDLEEVVFIGDLNIMLVPKAINMPALDDGY